jgi:predicted  nucleic acid-binding Zn-ribbon protein
LSKLGEAIPMFRCERCGSNYNALYAATLENCPRCQVRDRAAAPLTFKAFRLNEVERVRSAPLEATRVEPAAPGEGVPAAG